MIIAVFPTGTRLYAGHVAVAIAIEVVCSRATTCDAILFLARGLAVSLIRAHARGRPVRASPVDAALVPIARIVIVTSARIGAGDVPLRGGRVRRGRVFGQPG